VVVGKPTSKQEVCLSPLIARAEYTYSIDKGGGNVVGDVMHLASPMPTSYKPK